MKKRSIFIFTIALLFGAAFFAYPKLQLYFASQKATINKNKVEFVVLDSLSLEALANKLFEKKVIDDVKLFLAVGNYKEMNKANIALGKYELAPGVSYSNLLNGFKLNRLGNGNAEQEVRVTFNNCSGPNQLEKICGKVAQHIQCDSATLASYLLNPETSKSYGFSMEEFPAMFLSNTYQFYYDSDAKKFTDRMAKEFKAFWSDERISKLRDIGLNKPSEAYTLGSIVYSEQSRISDEWPVIAGLYLNRLNQRIKLQSDPTFKFCWGSELDGVQRLLYKHRDIDCEYNTYKHYGLPPGPICIIGKGLLDAVLNPSNVDYIFMCAKADYSGRHNFTNSGRQHVNNANEFQRWLTIEQKK
ncbi:MAG: endolytic transglycosylase MltG [Crocinitomicaceae bacterium]|nr:endolytic transglycosylase MltG [Crocinitomicaceae bacterium]MDG1736010.1 endolytic transglycosylase MltG [Crocinitomicaceae bacterium]MDG2506599.1 endolytic transglycosylase MltG [Crocinitomicaceae bacterium]